MASAPNGIRTKFASSASDTSRRLRSGAAICFTVRLKPTASMLETTKTSIVAGTALLRYSICTSGSAKATRCSFHLGEIPPEVRQAVGAPEERREVGVVDQQNVPGAWVLRRHPDEGVELRVARGGEGMRAIRIDELASEHLHGPGVLGGQLVMRQVKMKIEGRDVLEHS